MDSRDDALQPRFDDRPNRSPTRRSLLRSGCVAAGAGLLAGCTSVVGGGSTPTPTARRGESLPLSYGHGGGGCLPDEMEAETWWVHTAAHGERDDLTFDAQVAYDAGAAVEVSLTRTGDHDYELTFRAGETETEREKTPGRRTAHMVPASPGPGPSRRTTNACESSRAATRC